MSNNHDGDRAANAERLRLEQQRTGVADWNLWGPYLAARAWGTVREDYSAQGDAWDYFGHDQARLRAYRWSEDGLGGICDEQQRLCFALAMWNGSDEMLKERAFGLTNGQGNRGESVEDLYFHLDATPSHSWLRFLYRYPQQSFPYADLVAENAARGRQDDPYQLMDTGVFDAGFWDVQVTYAKASPRRLLIRIAVTNHGDEAATLHLMPTLWFRNTWSWSDDAEVPRIATVAPPPGAAWAVEARHAELGGYRLSGQQTVRPLFTDNETNTALLWGKGERNGYYKDAFHRRVIQGDEAAVRDGWGTKFTPWMQFTVASGRTATTDLWLDGEEAAEPPGSAENLLARRRSEADVFYDELEPAAGTQEHRILRQALAGMIWGKQYYHYNVERWLSGDRYAPPESRLRGRNHHWRHVRAADIISMPDTWEYPWFAAWDLAYQCAPLALADIDFAKRQVEVLLGERYLHPNGQIPAYEWDFSDSNPPVHAIFALRVYRAEARQRGQADRSYLRRVFHKLLLNFTWWINRKDNDGNNLFDGGFLGLDNISVIDRSRAPLPPGYQLMQADATGWMAMYALNLTVIALELAVQEPDYEDIAVQCYEHFLAIAESIAGHDPQGVALWDEEDGFYKDVIVGPDGAPHRIDVFSWVGLIPLFACEVLDARLLAGVPRFRALLHDHRGGRLHGHYVSECPQTENARGEHLLALVDKTMLGRVMERLLDDDQFLSPFGIRSLSRRHAAGVPVGDVPGVGPVHIEYVPGEADSPMYGGNSNWRGPVWLPTNYSLIQALERYHRYLGDGFRVAAPCLDGREITLSEAAVLISERVVNLYRRDRDGHIPAMAHPLFRGEPAWRDLTLFYEYFHAETGRGLGASHQTGWTGLLANLVLRRYRHERDESGDKSGIGPAPQGGG